VNGERDGFGSELLALGALSPANQLHDPGGFSTRHVDGCLPASVGSYRLGRKRCVAGLLAEPKVYLYGLLDINGRPRRVDYLEGKGGRAGAPAFLDADCFC